jgi:hypothetical protein
VADVTAVSAVVTSLTSGFVRVRTVICPILYPRNVIETATNPKVSTAVKGLVFFLLRRPRVFLAKSISLQ